MVKFNPDLKRLRRLEKLRKEKEETEKELEDIEKEKEEQIKKLERRLEEAVADLANPPEEEMVEEDEPGVEVSVEDAEMEDLEQTVLHEREREMQGRGEGGSAYEIERSDLESIPDMYGDLVQELEQGNFDSPVVDRAREVVYQLENKTQDAYASRDVKEWVTNDASDEQYVSRLKSLLDTFDEQTGRNMYKQ